MIESATRGITHNGKAAQLSVMRNNGECWGRIRFADVAEQPLDVVLRGDCYDKQDSEALDAFEQAARRGRVEPAAGWL